MSKLLLLFPMFLATAFAQLVYILPRLAQQGYVPLNPGAVDHPVITSKTISKGSVLSQFTVTDYSSKTVTSIEYGWRVSAPSACSESSLGAHWNTATVEVTIGRVVKLKSQPPMHSVERDRPKNWQTRPAPTTHPWYW